MKKKQDLSPAQFLLALCGVVAWIAAGYFGIREPANTVAAAGVLGFALAGGLCFLGVSLGGGKGRDGGPPVLPPPG